MPAKSTLTIEQRFWRFVDTSGDCWLWTGARNEFGYGKFSYRVGGVQRCVRAHRFAWELVNGPIPDGLFLCHACDVKACVRPGHVRPGTRQFNADEAAERGLIQNGARHWARRTPERKPLGERFHRSSLTAESVRAMRERYARGGVTQEELAREHGITRASVRDILRRRNWKHV